jgi:cytochrome c oxidase subunit 4
MSNPSIKSDHHVTPLKIYLGVGVALIVLTAITVGVAQINLGGWNAIVAVLIASIKATLVAFIFMHLWYDRKIFLIIFSIAILFLTIFIALTMFDILSRGHIDKAAAAPIEMKAKMYDKLEADTPEHQENHQDSTLKSEH